MTNVRQQHPLLMPIAVLASGLALILFSVALYVFSLFYGAGPGEKGAGPKEVAFTQGMSVSQLAQKLEHEKVIRSAALFKVVVRLNGGDKGFQAGTYAFPPRASLMQVYQTIKKGDVIQLMVTIPEGKTSRQAVQILMGIADLTGDVEVPPEGAILPETYTYERGESRQAVLDRMLKAGRETLDQLWETRDADLPFKSKEEALILASVVEKETGIKGERPRVAAVFVNRLRSGMRLESDPTVIYGVSKGEPLGRGLMRSELDKETPWNTYRINGLPITPIANPGKAAIDAVLHPAKTKDLFFVADGTGGHVFAETYEQHLENVARWRQIERQEAQESNQDASASVTAIQLRTIKH